MLLSLILFLSGCCEDGVRTSSHNIPKNDWIGVLNFALADLDFRINNYTSVKYENYEDQEHAYYVSNDCSISLLGQSLNFNIPVQRYEPLSIYVVDINAQSASVNTTEGKLQISLSMESNGPEFWTNCVSNAGCFAIGNRNVNIEDFVINLRVQPIVESGRITYNTENIEIDIDSEIRVSGCNDDLFAFLCDIFMPDRENTIKNSISFEFEKFMKKEEIRSIFSNAIMVYIRDVQGINEEIVSAGIAINGNLLITSENLDPTCEE